MGQRRRGASRGPGEPPPELCERLRERRGEIEQAVLAKAREIADPTEVSDPGYAAGLSATVHSAVGLGLAALEASGDPGPLPTELGEQARLAARNSVGLEVVLRRYAAGHALLCHYLLAEVGQAPAASVAGALRAEVALLERIVASVCEAYRGEVEERRRASDQRHTDQVKRLLTGEPHDTVDLGYDLSLWHLGVLASGVGAPRVLRELAALVDRRLLLVRPGGKEVWGWLGGHRKLTAHKLIEWMPGHEAPEVRLAIGEPGRGISGWRLTHRQARVALPVALRGESRAVAYSDVALLASALGDEVLTDSLTDIYLAPLAAERDGGSTLRRTLRAYFAAGRQVTSAAAELRVSRQTVNAHLRTVEERIGRPLESCGTELETALRLWDLHEHPAHPSYIRQVS